MLTNKEYAINIRRLTDEAFIRQAEVFSSPDEALRWAAANKPEEGEFYDVVKIRYADNENEIGSEVVAAIM